MKRKSFHNFLCIKKKVMKTTGFKLKKLKTKQVYGFKKDQYAADLSGDGDPTLTTAVTLTHIALNGINYN